MKVLLQILATLVVLGAAIAGFAEILGFMVGPLNGPQWVNAWQYGLVMAVGCLFIAFEADNLVESGKLALRLLSFPLLFWIVAGAFAVLFAIWRTDWTVLVQFIASLGLIVLAVYALYLDTRYLLFQVRPGYFSEPNNDAEPIQPGD